jgi:predicted metal-dependent peptidase
MAELEIRKMLAGALQHIRERHDMILHVDLVIDYGGSYPKSRDFAKTTGSVIYFSSKILQSPRSRVEGLLFHELGHVLLMQSGDYDHSERRADIIAELCFGVPIYYDTNGVQTTAGGVRPRPSHLPR